MSPSYILFQNINNTIGELNEKISKYTIFNFNNFIFTNTIVFWK